MRLLNAGNVSAALIAAYVTQYAIAPPPPRSPPRSTRRRSRCRRGVAPRAGRHSARRGSAGRAAWTARDAGGRDRRQGRRADAANAYLAWYDVLYDEPAGGGAAPAWVNERMEYHFSDRCHAADTPCAFLADQYAGEPLDWPSFDHVDDATRHSKTTAGPGHSDDDPSRVIVQGDARRPLLGDGGCRHRRRRRRRRPDRPCPAHAA